MTSHSHRLSLQAWLALLTLGLALWWTTTNFALIIHIATIVFGAILVSLAIRPLVDRMARWRIARGVTVLAIYAMLVIAFNELGDLITPMVDAQTQLLRTRGPTLLDAATAQLAAMPILSSWLPSLSTLTQTLTRYLETLVPSVLQTVVSLGDLTLSLLVVLVLAYFFATDQAINARMLHMLPARYHAQAATVAERLHFRLTRWVLAQLAIALYFALAFGIVLAVLRVPFALTISLLGGILEIIPYIGGAIALLLALVSALTVSPWLALWVLLLYVVVVQVQSHVVAPIFYGRAIDLHPAAVVVALFAGATLGGIIGVFFAVPLTVIITTILDEVHRDPVIEDEETVT